jgi:hypothetical protein
MFHFIYFLINTLAWGIIFTMLPCVGTGLLSVAAHRLANGPDKLPAIAPTNKPGINKIVTTVPEAEEPSQNTQQQRKSATSDPSMAIAQGLTKRHTPKERAAKGSGGSSSLVDLLRQEAGKTT